VYFNPLPFVRGKFFSRRNQNGKIETHTARSSRLNTGGSTQNHKKEFTGIFRRNRTA
jgi:hypothetical protein